MTREEREEALAVMNVIIHMIEKQYDNDRVEKAVDTAIAALKAESCEDAVSREAALKAFGELPHEYKTKEQRARTGGIAACQVIVKELPPVTPTAKESLVVGDAVSLSALMQALTELGYGDEENGADAEYMSALYDVAEKVKALPPVTPKQRWIPVDYDRYPETYPMPFQEVWITDGYGEVYHEAYGGTRSIKAWMPYVTPEPYKEGESE